MRNQNKDDSNINHIEIQEWKKLYEQLLTVRRTEFLIEDKMSETYAQTTQEITKTERRSSVLDEKRKNPRLRKHLRGTAEICT